MRIEAEFECPGCELKGKVQFKRPGVIGAEVFSYTCTHCKSTVLARVWRPKAGQPGQVMWNARLVKASQGLLLLKQEEAQHLAKPVDQVDAEAAT